MAYTTINKHTAHFETKLYAGSSSNVTVSGLEFQPDWIWLKNRSATDNHAVVDAVRGSGSYGFKNLYPNLTDGEYTPASGNASVVSIASSSFVVGQNSNTNGNGENFVSWNWKANGAGSANTDGSITSTVSVNTTAGFSIVRWSGSSANATIGHGLGVVPKMIICKDTNDTYNWGTYHQAIGNTKYLYLNTNAAEATSTSAWNDTTPTSTVFSVGNAGATNASGTNNMIAYCFAEKTGYSKFGSYTGIDASDNAFVYCGFAPSWIMFKRTDSANSWGIFDNKRDALNPNTACLDAENSDAESSVGDVDFLSNGFRIRSASGLNGDGQYIYMAFGQSLVGSNNVPCTAR